MPYELTAGGRLPKRRRFRTIFEYNTWHDTYWDVCSCPKHNSYGAEQTGNAPDDGPGTVSQRSHDRRERKVK